MSNFCNLYNWNIENSIYEKLIGLPWSEQRSTQKRCYNPYEHSLQ